MSDGLRATPGKPPSDGRETWHLFCRVVDNLGDIGIAWRLARQLAADPHRAVGLIVDGLDAFARIEPRIDRRSDRQSLDRIDVMRWPADNDVSDRDVASVVVELLGCGLPTGYLDAMASAADAAGANSTVWIDYEHLSAEPWVAQFHGLPSPHPALPLVKHFFYPGFGPRTGGLLIEPDLERRREAFVDAPDEAAGLWRRLGVPPPAADETRLSLFAYDDAPLAALMDALAGDIGRHWAIVVPEGPSTATRVRCHGSLSVMTIPFVDQDEYDRLLWACDINFVRGEDSFVRAQAAGRPFVWQIYRQADAVHLQKLLAFEDLYEATMPAAVRTAHRAFWEAWNSPRSDLHAVTEAWFEAQPALRLHAEAWRLQRAAEAPLIERLLAFVAARRRPAADSSPRRVC